MKWLAWRWLLSEGSGVAKLHGGLAVVSKAKWSPGLLRRFPVWSPSYRRLDFLIVPLPILARRNKRPSVLRTLNWSGLLLEGWVNSLITGLSLIQLIFL